MDTETNKVARAVEKARTYFEPSREEGAGASVTPREAYRRPGVCLFCYSRLCYTAIYEVCSGAGGYDEVCCRRHVRELELDADARCPRTKMHVSSSEPLRRQRGSR